MERYELTTNENFSRKATAQELAEVPTMTREEMREVMRSEEYKQSALVRELVAASMAKSNVDLNFDEPASEQHGRKLSGDEVEARKAAVTKLFRDPRYRYDAEYRREVALKMAEYTGSEGSLSADALKTPNQSVSIGHSTFENQGADLRVRGFNRVELAMKPFAEKPAKPAREPFGEGQ